MRISSLVFISFSFILLLFAATTYINFRQSERVKENSDYLTLSTSIVQNSNRFQRNILNMTSGLRGFLLTGENYFLQTYDSAAQENIKISKELSTQVSDTSRQYQLLQEIDKMNLQWINDFAHPLRQAKINAEASEKSLSQFNRIYQEKMFISEESKINILLQQKIREFINLEYKQRQVRRDILAASVQRTKNITFILTILSILAGFFIVSFLAYRISKRILKMVNMANYIAAGNYHVHTEDKGKDELSRLAKSLNNMAMVLSKNISELTRKNRELDQFAHIVSHDLKAPLRGIDNVVTWIEEDHKEELSPKVAEYIQLIKGRVIRGENLINGLLSYARIGKEDYSREEVNVYSLIYEILENFNLPVGMQILVSKDLPVLETNKIPLLQIFTNLIGNAIKYNDKAEGRIEIYHEDHTHHYKFFVEDNGMGISQGYHNKVFEIFQTLQERDSFESTGVGLAIVKKILDSRNEKIELQSQPGKGTIFSFTWKKNIL